MLGVQIKKLVRNVIIILIMVILAILLIESATNIGGGPLGSYCTPFPKFYCSTYGGLDNFTGNASYEIGQNAGNDWYDAEVLFVPYGVSNSSVTNTMLSLWSTTNVTQVGTMMSGNYLNVNLHLANAVPIATKISGSVWVRYRVSNQSTYQYARIGITSEIAT